MDQEKIVTIRLSPGLHARIRGLAFGASLSMNKWCVRELEEAAGLAIPNPYVLPAATVEKLGRLQEACARIPHNDGENSVSFTMWPGYTCGSIHYMLRWKTENGEQDFCTLDEAIGIVEGLLKRTAKAG